MYKAWNEIVSESCPVVSDSLQPHGLHSPGILQARMLEWVAVPFSTGSSQPRDQTQVSRIAGRFFTSWATREAKEYWGVSLSFLQQIFLTQESKQGLLHCRRILWQLNYQGSWSENKYSLLRGAVIFLIGETGDPLLSLIIPFTSYLIFTESWRFEISVFLYLLKWINLTYR